MTTVTAMAMIITTITMMMMMTSGDPDGGGWVGLTAKLSIEKRTVRHDQTNMLIPLC